MTRTEKLSIGVDDVRDLVRSLVAGPGRAALPGDDRRGRRPAHRPRRQRAAQGDRGAHGAARCGCCAHRRPRTSCPPSARAPGWWCWPPRAPTTSPASWSAPRGPGRARRARRPRQPGPHRPGPGAGRRRRRGRAPPRRGHHPGPADHDRALRRGRRPPGRAGRRGGRRDRPGALDERELGELQSMYGVVERGRRPREYAPALRDLEKQQTARPSAGCSTSVDRGLMDLVSVYRDAIALQVGAPGRAGQRGAPRRRRRAGPRLHPGAEPRPDRGGVHRPRADAGVQRAAAPGAGVVDGRAPAGVRAAR